MKNPAFAEVAADGDVRPAPAHPDPATAAGIAAANKYLTAARAAAVTSKMAEADVTMRNLRLLAAALVNDACTDPLMTADELAAVASTNGGKAFMTRSFAVMRTHVATH